ncbi:MAG: hypothetical protein LLF92_05510 [Planctomycetaceae bacterium]|nr:hypothetical protein [Planctomycetaceae bacterium]
MKKKIVLLVILVMGFAAGNALANALLSPGFEQGDLGRFETVLIPGWATYGTNGECHNDANAVKSGVKAVKEWLDDTGMFQDFPVVGGNEYDFSVWAITLSSDGGGLSGRDAIFKVEWYDDANTLIFDEEVGRFYGDPASGTPDPYDTWKFISGASTAPLEAAYGRIFLGLTAGSIGPDTHIGSINWDDVSVTYRYGASNPGPTNGAINLIPFDVATLSWDRPAPRQSGDTILCDVWFGTDPNMPGTNTKILNKQDASSVVVSSLDSFQDYYWRVDCYDPDGANPEIKSEGWRWKFSTADNCGLSYLPGDINKDCYVNFVDFAEMAENWLKCNDMSNSNCP